MTDARQRHRRVARLNLDLNTIEVSFSATSCHLGPELRALIMKLARPDKRMLLYYFRHVLEGRELKHEIHAVRVGAGAFFAWARTMSVCAIAWGSLYIKVTLSGLGNSTMEFASSYLPTTPNKVNSLEFLVSCSQYWPYTYRLQSAQLAIVES